MAIPLGVRARRGNQELLAAGPATFNPATLALSGWWRASYTGSPWVAVASAGNSGTNGNLTEATNPPATGAALNLLTPADFDGVNDKLGNANAMDTAFIDTATPRFHLTFLLNADTAGANNVGNAYLERALWCDDTQGLFNVTHAVRGVTISAYDGAWKEATVACPTAGWHLVHVWTDGVNLFAQIDSSAPVTGAAFVAFGAAVATVPCIGRNYDAGAPQFFDGKIAEIMVSKVDLGATARANIKSYINSRYALAL